MTTERRDPSTDLVDEAAARPGPRPREGLSTRTFYRGTADTTRHRVTVSDAFKSADASSGVKWQTLLAGVRTALASPTSSDVVVDVADIGAEGFTRFR
jgi:hypothetical protein